MMVAVVEFGTGTAAADPRRHGGRQDRDRRADRHGRSRARAGRRTPTPGSSATRRSARRGSSSARCSRTRAPAARPRRPPVRDVLVAGAGGEVGRSTAHACPCAFSVHGELPRSTPGPCGDFHHAGLIAHNPIRPRAPAYPEQRPHHVRRERALRPRRERGPGAAERECQARGEAGARDRPRGSEPAPSGTALGGEHAPRGDPAHERVALGGDRGRRRLRGVDRAERLGRAERSARGPHRGAERARPRRTRTTSRPRPDPPARHRRTRDPMPPGRRRRTRVARRAAPRSDRTVWAW